MSKSFQNLGQERKFLKVQLYLTKLQEDIVLVTFNGNLFHPSEGLFGKVLPIYYTVIARERTDIFVHLLVRKYFIIVQLRSPVFRFKLLWKFLNAQN